MSGQAVPLSATAVAIAAVETGLAARFDEPVWVASKIPSKRRPRMVRVTRVPGGGLINAGVTDLARWIVECWAPDDVEAERLANVVRIVLREAIGHRFAGGFVRWWKEDSGPYSWPDPDQSQQARWQLTGEMRIKVPPG